MFQIRKAQDRGKTEKVWLKSYHSFSFGSYEDARHTGFRSLLVINEDIIAPGRGFPFHPHQNMEIITYVISGFLKHKDSTNTEAVLKKEEVQIMSAGSGIVHSEYNDSSDIPLHLLQIWILPEKRDLPPSHREKSFPKNSSAPLQLLASPDARENSLKIFQDVFIYRLHLQKEKTHIFSIQNGRFIWIQVIQGSFVVNGVSLEAGDGLQVTAEKALSFAAKEEGDLLLFDLA